MIFIASKKKILGLLLTIVCLSLSILVIAEPNLDKAVFAGKKKIPIYCVETEERMVGLTFDAAWGADKTLDILNILDKFEAKATFFLVGFWIDKFPEMVKEIDKRGHQIGNHSLNHLHANQLSKEDISKEIHFTNEKLENITGKIPTYFRPPFGEYNDRLIEYNEGVNIKTIQWDVDSLDWKGLSAKEIAMRIDIRAKKGSIILCHNNSDHIVEALPLILTSIASKGLKPVRLDNFVIDSNYYIDNNGKQIKK